ncbi:MAG: hypothetical protein LR015_04830 [Verrucomicrobia bacterium]|nr:hypothetical protein [Verrucomicrobiota bacterium]
MFKAPTTEAKQAEKFPSLFYCGIALIAVVVLAWTKALESGGMWWIMFAVCAVAGLIIGEKIKRRLESMIRISRESRKQSEQIGRGDN